MKQDRMSSILNDFHLFVTYNSKFEFSKNTAFIAAEVLLQNIYSNNFFFIEYYFSKRKKLNVLTTKKWSYFLKPSTAAG